MVSFPYRVMTALPIRGYNYMTTQRMLPTTELTQAFDVQSLSRCSITCFLPVQLLVFIYLQSSGPYLISSCLEVQVDMTYSKSLIINHIVTLSYGQDIPTRQLIKVA